MIESIQKIHSRIGEIQNTFNKLGFAPLNTQLPIKPFSEYLNEAMANSSENKINNSEGSLLIENNIKNNKIDNGKIIDEEAFNGKLSFGVYDDITNNFAKAINAYKKTSTDFPNTYDNIIKEASEKYSVPEYLIKAVIKQESNYMPNAISSKGAIGLMQIMPSTGALLGVDDKELLKDPYINIMT